MLHYIKLCLASRLPQGAVLLFDFKEAKCCGSCCFKEMNSVNNSESSEVDLSPARPSDENAAQPTRGLQPGETLEQRTQGGCALAAWTTDTAITDMGGLQTLTLF